jgi:hypothetical protein
MSVKGSWSMFPTKDASRTLDSAGAAANAAIDMFLDQDPQNATAATTASYEVMIWFAQYGYANPFGPLAPLRHTVPVQQNQDATL